MLRGELFLGPSGWSYPGWRRYLPQGLPLSRRLHYFSRLFGAIEINGSFYKQIRREVYAEWRRMTPPGFRFALKGHRFVTHYKRLRDCADSIDRLRGQADGLGRKLGVVLWQLPSQSRARLDYFDDFLLVLSRGWRGVRQAFEFRHPSWFSEPVLERLRSFGAAVCLSDAPDFPLWDVVTSDFVYLRLHGHERKYASSYSPALLRQWAKRIGLWRDSGLDVHVYFDNDAEGAAIVNAQALAALTAEPSTKAGTSP